MQFHESSQHNKVTFSVTTATRSPGNVAVTTREDSVHVTNLGNQARPTENVSTPESRVSTQDMFVLGSKLDSASYANFDFLPANTLKFDKYTNCQFTS